jgi:hypothetical protein
MLIYKIVKLTKIAKEFMINDFRVYSARYIVLDLESSFPQKHLHIAIKLGIFLPQQKKKTSLRKSNKKAHTIKPSPFLLLLLIRYS